MGGRENVGSQRQETCSRSPGCCMAKAGFNAGPSLALHVPEGQVGLEHPPRQGGACCPQDALLLGTSWRPKELCPRGPGVNGPEVGPAFSDGQREREARRYKSGSPSLDTAESGGHFLDSSLPTVCELCRDLSMRIGGAWDVLWDKTQEGLLRRPGPLRLETGEPAGMRSPLRPRC